VKIEDVFRFLERGKVKYAVVGGVAVVLYGYVRFTNDIDLVIDFSKENVKRFIRIISRLHFQSGVPIAASDLANSKKRAQWRKEKNAKVITFYNQDTPLLSIDVLLIKTLSQIKITKKKIDDLIAMKREAGRPTDLIDIEKLGKLNRE
jgi:hypothetical protein